MTGQPEPLDVLHARLLALKREVDALRDQALAKEREAWLLVLEIQERASLAPAYRHLNGWGPNEAPGEKGRTVWQRR